MIKEIKYGGLSVQPSDYECSDGELTTAINLINEYGNISSISPPLVEMSIPEDDENGKLRVVFVHNISNSVKHYIFYNEVSHNLYYMDTKGGNLKNIDYFFDFTRCDSIGNTLLVLCESGMTYVLWKEDGTYEVLGNALPKINVSFGLQGTPLLYSRSNGRTKGFNVDFAEGINITDIRKDFSKANQTKITEQVMANLNLFIKENTIDKGRFCFPFFIRYALRLYDGSLVCHSAPILMNPSTTPTPIVLWSRVTGKDSYSKAEDCDIMMVSSSISYRIEEDGYDQLEKWQDIIKSVDIFISKPIYTYDQEGKITSFYDTDNFDSEFIGVLTYGGINTDGSLVAYDDFLIIGSNKKYIQWKYSQIYHVCFGKAIPGDTFHLPEFSKEKQIETIENCHLFYKLHSIKNIESERPNKMAARDLRYVIYIEDDYLGSLTTREVMTDDYLSHDRLIPSSSQVYNSRLNLSGVKRSLFNGFPPVTQFAYCNDSLGTYITNSDGTIKEVKPAYESDTIRIDTYIREGGKHYIVSSESEDLAPWMSRMITVGKPGEEGTATREKRSWGSYLFYPNVNAYRMVITSRYGGKDGQMYSIGQYVVDLTPHEFLNGSYSFLGYNKTREDSFSVEETEPIQPPNLDFGNIVDNSNKIFTSEVNNPFFFPLSGINTIGTGRILGISTAAKALSEGQFGQFPLYAFTDDGVWAMEVSSTGTYTARQPITRDVCINPSGITQIDSAVLFPTDRGIMLISGSQTECISDIINADNPFDILNGLPKMSELHAMLGHGDDNCIPVARFIDFVRDCKMIYDYVHQRIIIYNKSHSYAYVYSLKTKLWGMMHSDITENINSYPEALAITSSGDLVNFSKSDTSTPVKGLLVTRPLKLDEKDIHKTIDTVIQRGNFRRGHVKSVLYGSRDLIHWYIVWSSKDHFMRGFHGTPYKYFRIALLCELSPGESLSGATVQYRQRKTNQPR